MAAKTSFLDLNDFINITNKEISYFLGFFWSDGYIDKNSICIEIKDTDGEEIFKILNSFGKWNTSTRIRNEKYKLIRIYASNIDIVKYLKENDFDKKSFVSPTKILSNIPDELKKYFYRGLIDGDGCFSSKLKNTKKNRIDNRSYFSLTERIDYEWSGIFKIFDSLDIKYKFTQKERIRGNSSYIVISSKEEIFKLGNYIYSDYDNIGLTRKYLKYKEIVDRIIY